MTDDALALKEEVVRGRAQISALEKQLKEKDRIIAQKDAEIARLLMALKQQAADSSAEDDSTVGSNDDSDSSSDSDNDISFR